MRRICAAVSFWSDWWRVRSRAATASPAHPPLGSQRRLAGLRARQRRAKAHRFQSVDTTREPTGCLLRRPLV
jgi:hypothetical protein